MERQDILLGGPSRDGAPDTEASTPSKQLPEEDGRLLNSGANGQVLPEQGTPPILDSLKGSESKADSVNTQASWWLTSISTYAADGKRITKMRYGSEKVISVMWPPDVDLPTVHTVEELTVDYILRGTAPSTAFDSALEMKGSLREGSSIRPRSTDETVDTKNERMEEYRHETGHI
jgi:hypothetical protein